MTPPCLMEEGGGGGGIDLPCPPPPAWIRSCPGKTAIHLSSYAWCNLYWSQSSARYVYNLRKSQLYTYLGSEGHKVPSSVTEFVEASYNLHLPYTRVNKRMGLFQKLQGNMPNMRLIIDRTPTTAMPLTQVKPFAHV